MKNKICKKCILKSHCIDLPGFCLWLPYAAIGGIIIMFIYLISTSKL